MSRQLKATILIALLLAAVVIAYLLPNALSALTETPHAKVCPYHKGSDECPYQVNSKRR